MKPWPPSAKKFDQAQSDEPYSKYDKNSCIKTLNTLICWFVYEREADQLHRSQSEEKMDVGICNDVIRHIIIS